MPSRRLPHLLPWLLSGLLAGCAPDALNNLQAHDFNRYLDSLRDQCQNFHIGPHDIHEWLKFNSTESSEYTIWLDQTSRLYSRRITPEQYRIDIESSLGGGPHNAEAFRCIFAHLPSPSRTPAPAY